MSNFTYVSCFSGIGGFEQALNKLGGTCVLASEIDKYANQAYEVLYGEPTVGDITQVMAEDVPDHDLLVGGFPCQSFSVAGNRGGFEDARGTLFFEMARIAAEKKPKVFLAENVKGLLSHDKGRTMDTIVTTLSDIGYRVDFEVLNSKYFGVPQNRERVFLIGIREDLLENEAWDIPKGQTVVPKAKRRLAEYEDLKTFNFEWPEQTEVTTRLRDVLETDVDEKYYLSEDKTAKLVAQLEESDKVVGSVGHHPFSKKFEFKGYNSDISPSLIATDYKAPKTVLESEPQMIGHVNIKGHDAIKRVYSSEGVSPTLTTMGGGHREPKIAEQVSEEVSPKINIVGHSGSGGQKGHIYADEGIMATLTATDYKQPKQVAQEVRPVLTPDRLEKRQNGRRFKEDGEESFTLTAQDRHGVAIRKVIEQEVREIAAKSRPNTDIGVTFKNNGDIRPHRTDERKSGISELQVNYEDNPANTVTSAHAPKVYGAKSRYRIRKLTPLECWRLQGFPDEAHEAVKAAGISDSQRYKMAGNAVTVNVIDAIGRKLLPYL